MAGEKKLEEGHYLSADQGYIKPIKAKYLSHRAVFRNYCRKINPFEVHIIVEMARA